MSTIASQILKCPLSMTNIVPKIINPIPVKTDVFHTSIFNHLLYFVSIY